jgi:hypothetical protein
VIVAFSSACISQDGRHFTESCKSFFCVRVLLVLVRAKRKRQLDLVRSSSKKGICVCMLFLLDRLYWS